MSNPIIFNEDQLDCLGELMNISYGSATAAISEILNSFATLNIPSIKIFEASKIKEYLNDNSIQNQEQYIASQILNGGISGENIFLIDIISAKNLALEFGLEENEINNNELSDIVLEITNILSSATIGRLASDLETTVSFEPPTIQKIDSFDKLDDKYMKDYEQVIVISTILEFEDQKIKAQLILLTIDSSILWLRDSIDKILEDL